MVRLEVSLQSRVRREETGEDGVGAGTFWSCSGWRQECFTRRALRPVALAHDVWQSGEGHPEKQSHELHRFLTTLGFDQVFRAFHKLPVGAASGGNSLVPLHGRDDFECSLKVFDACFLSPGRLIQAGCMLQVRLSQPAASRTVLFEEARTSLSHERDQLPLKWCRASSCEVSQAGVSLSQVAALFVKLVVSGRNSCIGENKLTVNILVVVFFSFVKVVPESESVIVYA